MSRDISILLAEELSKLFSPEQVAYDRESRMMMEGIYEANPDSFKTAEKIGQLMLEHLSYSGDK